MTWSESASRSNVRFEATMDQQQSVLDLHQGDGTQVGFRRGDALPSDCLQALVVEQEALPASTIPAPLPEEAGGKGRSVYTVGVRLAEVLCATTSAPDLPFATQDMPSDELSEIECPVLGLESASRWKMLIAKSAFGKRCIDTLKGSRSSEP
eukprot:CAMPEP_0177283556 /NCGR_PEP_ID=MMETSP0367-20130122/72056_1 /TAXON_ID=447022 ORGANISM="Scrippsiella hangoei-like, Strain SHHI-4" /NCGR_SAMPLE_ID=MMETSP0367 /ASSEMBLY_ACC=CAM_ASM_000362 /LENGTH=151 /DNA_ID=CAMNT_0018740551 /DNA_START=283 /DNA_END=736 /DNA_ORIENTATION=-